MFKSEFLNGDLTVSELYHAQCEIWTRKNVELFGLTAVGSDNPFIIRNSLKDDAEMYWRSESNTCKLREHLESSNIIRDKNKMIKNSWDLEFNDINSLVGLSGLFIFQGKNPDGSKLENVELCELVEKINALESEEERLAILSVGELDGTTFVISKARVALLPLILPYGFKLKKSKYALRAQATPNIYLLRKINGVVKQKGWEYSNGKFSDGVNHFKDVNPYQYPLLNAILGEQVTEENFTRALDLMPEYSRNSIVYYSFSWFDGVENAILHSSRKFANAEKGKVVNYASLINAPRRYKSREMTDLCSNLILIKNKIKALEVSRSILYAPQKDHASTFSWNDVELLCDSFKVTTNSLAGRSRVLLDDVYVEDGLLNITWKGKTYNQYDIVFGRVPEEIKNRSSLSSLSRASYNYLNDAKRIMFCAKLRTQAVQVEGQIDNLTHEVPARVVFADIKGYSFGDAFIISRSFAKKLERTVTKKFTLDPTTLSEISVGDKLTIDDLVEFDQKNRFSSYRDIVVTDITGEELEITARAPFGVGDKITNLHGSKGIVCNILEDDQMPVLKNDLSDNMPAGPVDIVVPGVSIYRRKSTGQIFEAVTRALGIGEMTIPELNDRYGDAIREYDDKSIFEFEGREFKAPCGINHFIRLDHDACSKQSFAYIKSNYNYNLHVAEMELLNLAARGEYAILNELDIRSLNKHSGSLRKIRQMQETGVIAEEQADLDQMYDYMRCLGWDMKTNKPLTREDVESRWSDLYEIVSNNEIDLFE